MPEKRHVCPSKIIRKLRESPSGDDATIWNDKRTSLPVVCKKCIGAFFLSGRYVKSWYFNNERTHYCTIPRVKNYVKKFDKTGAKMYFRKNSCKFLSLILAKTSQIDMLEIYCCYCFYDVCLISYDNDDTCTDLYKRLKRHILDQFETKKKKGFCSCSLCKAPKYRDIWFLRLLSEWVFKSKKIWFLSGAC